MTRNFFASILFVTSVGFASISNSQTHDIFEFSTFINSPDIGLDSLRDTQITQTGDVGSNDFGSANLAVSFINSLNANNFGTLQWTITNNGSDLSDVWLFGFLDGEIDESLNTFFNETGSVANFIPGVGAADSAADSWEIDEPGDFDPNPGDIYDNLYDGALDNTNASLTRDADDVSMALGFDIGDFEAGKVLTATFDISETDNGGLFHFDPDSNYGFYYNGRVELSMPMANVSAPSAFAILIVSLLSFLTSRLRKVRKLIT